MKDAHKAVINFAYFTANFPYNWIEKCWEDDPHLAEHINSKFKGIVGDKGFATKGDVMELFMLMSETNQIKLLEWIDKNYLAFKHLERDV